MKYNLKSKLVRGSCVAGLVVVSFHPPAVGLGNTSEVVSAAENENKKSNSGISTIG